MSDLAARLSARSSAPSGIQPRVNPITAPDPWQGPLDLELAELETIVEASAPGMPARPTDVVRERGSAAEPRTTSHAGAPLRGREDPPTRSHEVELDGRRSTSAADLRSTIDPMRHEPPAAAPQPFAREPGAVPLEQVDRVVPARHAHAPEHVEALEQVDLAPPRRTEEPARSGMPSRSLRASARTLALGVRAHESNAQGEFGDRDEGERGESLVELDAEHEAASAGPPRSSSRAVPAARVEVAEAPREHDEQASGPRRSAAARARSGPGDPLDSLDAPLRAPRREALREPVVRVQIGRVELRSPAPREQARPRDIPKPDTFVTLAQYLRERGKS